MLDPHADNFGFGVMAEQIIELCHGLPVDGCEARIADFTLQTAIQLMPELRKLDEKDLQALCANFVAMLREELKTRGIARRAMSAALPLA